MATENPGKEFELPSVLEHEVVKGSEDPTLQLYLTFAGKDDEWKGMQPT